MKISQLPSLVWISLCLFLLGCASTPQKKDLSSPNLRIFNFSESDIDIYQDEVFLVSIKQGSDHVIYLDQESEVEKYSAAHKREDPSYSDMLANKDLIEAAHKELIDNKRQNIWVVLPVQSGPRKELCQVDYEYAAIDKNLGIFANLQIDGDLFSGVIWKTVARSAVNLIIPEQDDLQVTHIYTYKKDLESTESELGSVTQSLEIVPGKPFFIPDFWESSLAKLLPVKEINKSDDELSIKLLDVSKESRDEHLVYFLNKINGDLQLFPCTSRDLYLPIWKQSAALKYAIIKNLTGDEILKKIENPAQYFTKTEEPKPLIWEIDEVQCDEIVHIEGAERGLSEQPKPIAEKKNYILKSPARGSYIKESAPHFEWENPYYTPEESVEYTLYISENSDMENPKMFSSSLPSLKLENPLEKGKEYYWKVSDDRGGESDIQRFNITTASKKKVAVNKDVNFNRTTDAQASKSGEIYTSGYVVEEPLEVLNSTGKRKRLPTAQMRATKYTPEQEITWSRQISGSSDVYGRSLTLDEEGNTYICGYFWGEISLEGSTAKSAGGSDIILAKISNDGDLVWIKSWGNKENDIASSIDQQGDFLYISGYFRGSMNYGSGTVRSAGSTDAFVAKINSADGEVVWMQRFGEKYMDNISGIAPYLDGTTVYVTGTITHAPDGEEYKKNLFLASLNAENGSINWTRKAYSSGFSEANDLALDELGNIYLAGTFTEVLPFDDSEKTEVEGIDTESFIAIKFTPAGEVSVWEKIHTKGGGKATKILLTKTGVVLAGSFRQSIGIEGDQLTPSMGESDIFIALLGRDLSLSWLKSYGGEYNESISSLSPLSSTENHLLMLGKSDSPGLKWSDESEFEVIDGGEILYGAPFSVIFEVE